MRVLEIALVALVLLAVLRPLVPRVRNVVWLGGALGALVLGVEAAHLQFEGGRWQLLPTYAVGLAVGVAGLAQVARPGAPGRPFDRSRPGWPARVLGAAAALVVLASAGVAWALPVPSIPSPDGPLAVGTRTFVLTDASRGETFTDDAADVRQLPGQVWYPIAGRAVGEPAPWTADARAFAGPVAEFLGLPSFALRHLGLVRTNATADAPLAADFERYPVVVYVHGWGGTRTIQTDLVEALASHGFVVVGLDHTYSASAAQFPDGEVVALEPAVLPDDVPAPEYRAAARHLLTVIASDVASLLDALARDDGPLPADRLDLDRVGLIGYSAGGGAAAQACATVVSCDSLALYDPWIEPLRGEVVDGGQHAGLLVLRSEEWVGTPNDEVLRRHLRASTAVEGLLHIRGAGHGDLTLLPLLSPLARQFGIRGETATDRTHEVVRRYTTALFDRYLRDRDGGLLDAPPDAAVLVDDLTQ